MKTVYEVPAQLGQTFLELFDSRVAWHVKCATLVKQRNAAKRWYDWHALPLLGIMLFILVKMDWKPSLWIGVLLFILVFWSANRKFNGVDYVSLRLYDECVALFYDINQVFIFNTDLTANEIIEWLDYQVRSTIKEIKRLQQKSPMHKDVETLKSYLRNLIALVVRLELMGTNCIHVKTRLNDKAFYDEKAARVYDLLFANPDLKISGENCNNP